MSVSCGWPAGLPELEHRKVERIVHRVTAHTHSLTNFFAQINFIEKITYLLCKSAWSLMMDEIQCIILDSTKSSDTVTVAYHHKMVQTYFWGSRYQRTVVSGSRSDLISVGTQGS